MTGPAGQHPGASDATGYVLIPGAGASRQADITELILADHRRIGRLCRALYDTARYDDGPRPDGMPGYVWQRLADLLVAHTQAEEEFCYLPLFGAGDAELQQPLEVPLGQPRHCHLPAAQAADVGDNSSADARKCSVGHYIAKRR